MKSKIVIRSETEADLAAITDVTVAAFKTLEISHHTEQFIVEALSSANALLHRSERDLVHPRELLGYVQSLPHHCRKHYSSSCS